MTASDQAPQCASQVPSSAPEKNPHLYKTNVGSFQLNPPLRVGEIISADEIPSGDEIRLDGGWVDLISSALADFIRATLGFHRALRDFIELYTDLCYNQFDKQEFDKGV